MNYMARTDELGDAMDIVEQIGALATPERIARIANLVGGSPDQARRGLQSAVPVVLGGILGAGSDPGAAQALGHALERAAGLDVRTGVDPAAVATAGSDMVAAILGGSDAGALAQSLARHAGLTEAGAGSLLGVAGAMTLAGLGREAGEKGLDATGVLELLAGQKAAIARALPRDIAVDLRSKGVLADLAASAPMRALAKPLRAVSPVPLLPQAAQTRAGSLRWVFWVVLLAAATLLLAKLLAPPPTDTAVTPPAAVTAANPLVLVGIDVGATVATSLESVKQSLQSIKDGPSAQAALPRLMAARDQLDSVEDSVDSLPDAGHDALKQMLAVAMPGIQEQADRVLDIDAASSSVKPVVDDILAQLTAWSN